MASRVPDLMQAFEQDQLARLTPCTGMDRPTLIGALAEVHVEFELIHPFREGNGRVGRLLCALMVLQAGLPLLNYDLLVEQQKGAYFAAIQAGLDRDYAPMAAIFSELIDASLALFETDL